MAKVRGLMQWETRHRDTGAGITGRWAYCRNLIFLPVMRLRWERTTCGSIHVVLETWSVRHSTYYACSSTRERTSVLPLTGCSICFDYLLSLLPSHMTPTAVSADTALWAMGFGAMGQGRPLQATVTLRSLFDSKNTSEVHHVNVSVTSPEVGSSARAIWPWRAFPLDPALFGRDEDHLGRHSVALQGKVAKCSWDTMRP
jgi:hypothetical protein